ncbi:hypothetical protein STEG23_033637, partial [Scotinomys teguina]
WHWTVSGNLWLVATFIQSLGSHSYDLFPCCPISELTASLKNGDIHFIYECKQNVKKNMESSLFWAPVGSDELHLELK